jgi:hypothetical protein
LRSFDVKDFKENNKSSKIGSEERVSSKGDQSSYRNIRMQFKNEDGEDFELEDMRVRRNKVLGPQVQTKIATCSITYRPVTLRQSIDKMKLGIKAIKFHYSKKKTRECTLRLSEDAKTLYWNY